MVTVEVVGSKVTSSLVNSTWNVSEFSSVRLSLFVMISTTILVMVGEKVSTSSSDW